MSASEEPIDLELTVLSAWLADPARDPNEWRWHGERLGWVRTLRAVAEPPPANGPPLPVVPPELRPWLTYAEAAELARVDPETIRRWVWQGRLASHKAGARPLIERTTLERFIRDDGNTTATSLTEPHIPTRKHAYPVRTIRNK